MQTKCGPDANVSGGGEESEQSASEGTPEMGLLTCTKCKVEYPETSEYFVKNKRKLNGLDSWCRECRKIYVKRYATPPGVNPEEKYKIKKLREITECVVCGEPEKNRKQLAIDHDHRTGLIRGVLCQRCNMGIGHFRDDPELLRFAALYLEEKCACGKCDVSRDNQLKFLS